MSYKQLTPQSFHPKPQLVSSLTQQCLTNLRRGTSTPKTHLLGFMSQYIQDEQQIKIQQVDELCCYDRMKKLLIKVDDTREERKEQEGTLVKAMHIQARMNMLEKDLQQKMGSNGKQKQLSGGNIVGKLHNTRGKSTPKSKTQHFAFKPTMLDNLKQRGYQRFFQFQKIKKQTNELKIKSIIGEQVQSKFTKVMNQKDVQRRKLNEDNKVMERKLLQKNVELQMMRQQVSYLKQTVKELQERLFGASSQLQNAFLIASYQKWLTEYKQNFGEMSIAQLSRYIEAMKQKCLDKFDLIQNKKDQRLVEMTMQQEERMIKVRKEMEKLEKRENQLMEVNKNMKMNKELSGVEIGELRTAKVELGHLRQLILSLYTQWYEKRTQGEKQVMRSFNKLKENYSYQQMLQYVVFYEAKLSTNDKLNAYILKILRGVQKIRRLIYPMQSNEKLDPFLVMERIEGWVQGRIKERGMGGERNVGKVKGSARDESRMFLEMGE